MRSAFIPTAFISLMLASLLLGACSNGGGSDDSSSNDSALSQNVCSTVGLSTRIISGTACSESNSPIVEISIDLGNGNGAICSGTMIASQYVLTAAHCFFEQPVGVVVTAAGVSVAGESVTIHPDVRVDETQQAVFNDAAIIKLVQPVSLPTLPIVGSRVAASGDKIQIFGYGQTQDQTTSNDTVGTLRSGEMRVSSVDANFVNALYDGEGSNTCSGDSGGPALLNIDGREGIVAITSSGALVNCGVGDSSKFANVQAASILDFIVKIVPNVGII